ncbi:hypothetical protein KY290_034388 [Solanum tuberosum]|uniref:Uncharacterized protein n=1 Tax=Solanum tuberosum TaxID=4113 RepID=A0ABQ7U3G2_SOLTU|nr:hypothetical protein KY284_034637 [Solanum tuberosum]KAH0741345.1 hypothetical protein KY290_034388 [Solanum tuberosum]
MAEAFLQILLDNLTSFIQEELGLFFGFKDEFENLKSTFTTIQAVLKDAQEKQLNDKPLENWLQKLNVAAYEVDDILDECKSKAARLSQTKYGCYHPKIIPFRYKIRKRMKEMMEKLDAIAAERSFVLTEPEPYGRDKEKNKIVKILTNKVCDVQELSVLPILGMGGLGKTTLAQMVFNDKRVIEHFDPKIWICVSEDFDEKKLIKAIVESIEGKPLGDDTDLAPLQKKLQDMLNGKRYFLVLDDIWNENQEKWDKIKAVLKVGAQGASVLATTRLKRVGSIMGTLQPYELSNLSQEDCWLLFMKRAFENQEKINPNLVAIGKEIVKKCGGVPLAAKTLGGLLRFEEQEREWEHIRDSEIWNLPQDESSILPALRLSYHHLPLDLRQCFAYCAVFPKDTKMEKENLISLWMAHGFLLSKGKELEDEGNDVWKKLCLRSFFQDIEVKDGKTYFKMHDLIHDLATSLFTGSASSNNIREINVKGYPHMMSIGFAKVVSSYSCSHLQKIASLTCLKTLGCFAVGRKKSSQIGELRNLNLYGSISITHLERVKNDMDAKEANLSAKENLHSLSMKWDDDERPHRYESEEVEVLEALKPHSNLICLTISGFRGICLPEWMNHSVLKNVVSIVISGCKNCSCLPPFGELPCLKSLELWSGSAELEYVDSGFPTRRRFPSLRKLIIGDFDNLKGLLKKEGEEQFPVLEEMSIHWCPMFVIPTLSSVKKLVAYGDKANATGFISNLRALTSLCIRYNEEDTSLPEEMFKCLANLKYLNISFYYKLKELPTSLASLNALKHLHIIGCDALESLPEEGVKGLTSLTELSVHYCKMLKCLPEGLQYLTALTNLSVRDCPTLAKRCEKGIGEDWYKIAHIPDVFIS